MENVYKHNGCTQPKTEKMVSFNLGKHKPAVESNVTGPKCRHPSKQEVCFSV